MIKTIFQLGLLFSLLSSTIACAQTPATTGAQSTNLETEDQKTLYVLGILLGRNIQSFSLTPEELEVVKAGLSDAVNGAPPQVDLNVYGPRVDLLAQTRAAASAEGAKQEGQQFADGVAAQPGATKTDAGVVVRTITPGTGDSPMSTSIVRVHYEGKLIDGTVFDSSFARGEPAEFPLNQVVPCWTEGLQRMKKGEKAQVVCPSDMAYGDQGAPPDIPPGATLSFEVELLDFTNP